MIHDRLRMRRRHGDDGNVQPFAAHHLLQLFDVVDRYPAARLVTNLFVGRVEERGDLEPFLTKAGVISEREAEIAGAHDRDAQVSVEAENLPEVLFQIVSFVISLGVITLLFAMMFKWLPDAAVGWRDVWFGALITAVLFEIGKFAIGLYIGKQGLESTYGAAASIVVVLVWVYYSAQIVLFGAELTNVHANSREASRP